MPPSQIQLNWPLKKPHQLLYVELGPDNGGMVLGICEQGFSFRAVGPVIVQGALDFTFALDGSTRLTGSGEIAWSEENGKTGGLKFTNVSPQFRETLKAWLADDSTQKSVGREVTPAVDLPLDSIENRKPTPPAVETVQAKPPAVTATSPSEPAISVIETPAKIPAEANPIAPATPPVTRIEIQQATDSFAPPLVEKPVDERPVEPTGITESIPTKHSSVPEPQIVEPRLPAIQPPRVEEKHVEPKPIDTKPDEVTLPQPKRPAELLAPPHPELRSTAPLPAPVPPAESVFSLPNFRIPSPEAAPTSHQKPAAPLHPAPPPSVPPPKKEMIAEPKPTNVTELPPVEASTAPSVSELPPVPEADDPTRLIPPPVEEPFAEHEHEMPVSWEAEPARESPRMNRVAAASIIGLAFAILLVALGISFRRDIGEALIRFGESISGEERKPAATQKLSSDVPAQAAASGASQEKTSENPQPASDNLNGTNAAHSESSAPASVLPNQNSPAQTSSNGASEGGTGQNEFEQARTILKGNHRQRDLQDAVDLLSTASSKGFVPAMVTLADLYARGDGVEKNCAQARSLLEKAVQKGSPEARRRLNQLKKQGCP